MIRWVEIASQASRQRYECLSKLLNDEGHANQVDFLETSIDDFSETLREAMAKYEHIRVGSPFGERVTSEVSSVPLETMTQKSADTLIKIEGSWWARSMLTEGLTREVALLEKLDITESALIVGAGASCRAVIAALLKSGYKKFNITEKFEERARLLLKDLKATYFGVDFRFTPQVSVTQLPGVHSIVVNTTPLSVSNDLLNELYYCNFLKPEAVVIDLTLVPFDTPLLKAARQVGGRIVHGCDVATLVDIYWVKTSMGIDIKTEALQSRLKKIAETTPFDFSGFEIPDF